MGGPFEKPGTGSSGGAMRALSRLLEASAHAASVRTVEEALVREARALFDVSAVLLLRVEDGNVVVAAGDPEPRASMRLEDPGPVRRVLAEGSPRCPGGGGGGGLLPGGGLPRAPGARGP